MLYEGSNGSVELLADAIVIRRHGLANFLTQGAQGAKRIPISSIMSIQFKTAGWMAGMIQFTVTGEGRVAPGLTAATGDENAVLFDRKHQAEFDQLRLTLEPRIGKAAATNASGSVDELVRAADLVDRGFMTREEFDRLKSKVIG